jgi:hypothetical protein
MRRRLLEEHQGGYGEEARRTRHRYNLEESTRPRRLIGTSGRHLNFSVRRLP